MSSQADGCIGEDGQAIDDPALCLLCGAWLSAGKRQKEKVIDKINTEGQTQLEIITYVHYDNSTPLLPTTRSNNYCPLCGAPTGRRPRTGREAETNPGECSLHAKICTGSTGIGGCGGGGGGGGGGCGLFFLLYSSQILLMRGGRACYSSPIYLDEKGEASSGRGNGRPTFLSPQRYQMVADLFLANHIAKEVTRVRTSADSVIRMFWF